MKTNYIYKVSIPVYGVNQTRLQNRPVQYIISKAHSSEQPLHLVTLQ